MLMVLISTASSTIDKSVKCVFLEIIVGGIVKGTRWTSAPFPVYLATSLTTSFLTSYLLFRNLRAFIKTQTLLRNCDMFRLNYFITISTFFF